MALRKNIISSSYRVINKKNYSIYVVLKKFIKEIEEWSNKHNKKISQNRSQISN